MNILLTILISLIFMIAFAIRYKVNIGLVLSLFSWHTIFSIIYYNLTFSLGGDSGGYYYKSFLDPDFGIGTKFVVWLVSFFTVHLGFNFFELFLVFGFIGSLGMVFLYKSFSKIKPDNSNKTKLVLILILIIPSMHFWSSAVGKDAISFLATSIFIFSFSNKYPKLGYLSLAVFIMFLVRPHISLMMMSSTFLWYLIISKEVGLVTKFFAFTCSTIAFIVVLPFVLDYTGLQGLDSESIDNYVGARQSYNMSSGSSLDTTNMLFPVKLFTYLFRPLPYEAHSMLALWSSLENLVFLCLFVYFFIYNYKSAYQIIRDNVVLLNLVIYSSSTTIILALTTSNNLGLASRQKWMVLTSIFFIIFYIHSCLRYRKISNQRIRRNL